MQTVGIGMIGSGFMGLSYSQCVVAHVEGAHLVSITGGSRAGALAEEGESCLRVKPHFPAKVRFSYERGAFSAICCLPAPL